MIKITQGREQPYAVWRGPWLLKFFDNYSAALAYDEEVNPGGRKTGS